MKFDDSLIYGVELRSRREERDPLGLRENMVRADLLDELHGLCVPYRRKHPSPKRRGR